MTSNGKRIPESTGILKEETSIFALLMSLSCMLMSSSEQKKDFVSLVSPISAISPFLRLLVCTMVVLQLVQPEQEKQRQSRILDVLSVFMSSSPTALMSTSIEIWLRFSKVFPNLDFGAASMSSTESLSQLFLSLQLKLSQSHLLRNKVLRDSCSQTLKSQLCSFQPAAISLQ